MEKEEKTNVSGTATPVYVPITQEKEKKIICDVCGHANPEYTALCEQCSNYLKF